MAYKKQTIITGWLPYRLGGEIGYDYRRTYVLHGHWKIESIKRFLERRSLTQGKADHSVWDTSGKGRHDSVRVYDSSEGSAQVTPPRLSEDLKMARELDTEELLHWLAENCPNEFEIDDAEGDGTATITFSTNDEDEVHAQTPIGEQIGKLLEQRNYPAAKFIVEHERIHDQIQKNPGPGNDLLSEIDRANDEYKTTRDPCARCGIYSFEGNVPFDDNGEEIGDRYYCIDCIDSVNSQIEEWKEDQ